MAVASLPLAPAVFAAFKKGVDASEKKTKNLVGTWQKNISATFGDLPKDYEDGDVVVNKDYPRVKQKISQLFFRVPEVQTKPLRPGAALAAPVAAAALNQKLRDMRVSYMVDEVLTDAICASGMGVSEIEYEAISQPVKQKPAQFAQHPDEVFEGLVETGLAEYETVTVPTYECYTWRRSAPQDFLYPVSFDGSAWDDAPWLGVRFTMPAIEAKRQYKLSKDQLAAAKVTPGGGDETLNGEAREESVEDRVQGYRIWYRACYFDPKATHKDHFRRLVWFKGMDAPAVHEDSPYQRFDGTDLIGVRRYPIRVLSFSYVPDRPIPPSDVTITRPQVLELGKSRTIGMLQRERSLPIRWFDVNQVDEETESMLQEGRVQAWLPMNGPAQSAIGEIARANYPRETFELDRVVEQELSEAWSMGAPQLSAQTRGGTTATEVKEMSGALATRLDYDRAKVLRWFVEGAEVVFGLMQLFADQKDYVELVGENGAKTLVEWNKANLKGYYAFEARPDAALRLDAGADRQQALNLFSLLANDPLVDRRKLLQEVLRTHNMTDDVLMPQPPPPPPEKPNISFRFSDEALDPTRPHALMVYDILAKSGLALDPNVVTQARQLAEKMLTLAGANPLLGLADVTRVQVNMQPNGQPAQSQPQHGGPASQVQPLNKTVANEGRTK